MYMYLSANNPFSQSSQSVQPWGQLSTLIIHHVPCNQFQKAFTGQTVASREWICATEDLANIKSSSHATCFLWNSISVLNLSFNALWKKALRSGNPNLLHFLFHTMGNHLCKQMRAKRCIFNSMVGLCSSHLFNIVTHHEKLKTDPHFHCLMGALRGEQPQIFIHLSPVPSTGCWESQRKTHQRWTKSILSDVHTKIRHNFAPHPCKVAISQSEVLFFNLKR